MSDREESYEGGETPMVGDHIYAGNRDGFREDFVTVVRSVHGSQLTTAGWPRCWWDTRACRLVKRDEKMRAEILKSDEVSA